MRLSTNFTLAEFTKSQTATRKGLDNTPGEEHLANAKELFANVVQKVRQLQEKVLIILQAKNT